MSRGSPEVKAAPPPASVDPRERLMLSRAFARLDPVALAFAVGLVSGLGLAVTTAALLLKGGLYVGLGIAWGLAAYSLIRTDLTLLAATVPTLLIGIGIDHSVLCIDEEVAVFVL